MNELMERWRENVDLQLVIDYGGAVILAALILIVGFWISARLDNLIRSRAKASRRIDDTLGGFFGSLARYAVLAVVLVTVLNQFGVQTTSLVALIGAAGLAIGLALQGTLTNLAAGVMLILFQPFKSGHYVEAGGHSGTIKEIGLFFTELATIDNVKIILPNAEIWGHPITNYSANSERRCDLTIGVSYDTDLKTAENAIRAVIAEEQAGAGRILTSPAEPFVAVVNLGDSSVDFTARVWCKASDYWPLRWHLTRAIKERFDAEGVDIPFPTRTIVTVPAAAEAA